jgi:hypothetical protein
MQTPILWAKNYDECIKCHDTVHKHKAKGLCDTCYQKEHVYPQEYCSICGNMARVHKRVDKKAICRKCYKEPVHTCSICNKAASAAYKLNSTNFICDPCYTKHYRKKYLCSICNNTGVLAINTDENKVCVKCYPEMNNYCFKCGRDIKSPYIIDGNHVCNRCYEKAKTTPLPQRIDVSTNLYECTICGKKNIVQKIYSDGSIICPECYKLTPRICYSCNNSINQIYSYIESLPYCRTCYYKKVFYMMVYTNAKVWNENFYEIVSAFFDEKANFTSYETAYLSVLKSQNIFNSLHEYYIKRDNSFIAEDLYSIIDYNPQKMMITNDFAAFLCNNKLINNYNNSSRILSCLSKEITNLPSSLQKPIILFKEYMVTLVKKLEEKGWSGNYSRLNYYTCYLYLLTAIRFFSFIKNTLKISQVTELNNHIVDVYIKVKPYDKGNLRHFLKYINDKKLSFIRLTLPNVNYIHAIPVGISEDKQSQIFFECINNTKILIRDRIIVILSLLYALTPEEMQKLKKSNFEKRSIENIDTLFLRLRNTKYKLPDRLYNIFNDYLLSLSKDIALAFPGRLINKSLSLGSICRIIKQFDVTSKQLYYTAISNVMTNGFTQPALLMKAFGINCNTATRYYNLIKGSMDY